MATDLPTLTPTSTVVFLVDVDNTLLDKDRIQELDDVARHYPARYFVLVDDKLRILTAVKRAWGDRITTVYPPGRANSPTTPGRWRPARHRTYRQPHR